MKRSALLFTLISGIVYLSVSAYSVAPSRIGPTVLTGCGGSACHGTISSATIVTITLKNGSTTVTDNKYQPGVKYHITVSGTNGSKSHFGYICFATNTLNKTAGTFSAIPAGSQLGNTGNVAIVEHTSPIASSSLSMSFDWTAPNAGTGNVKLTAYVNAVDNSGTSTGDAYNGTDITLAEASTSITSLTTGEKITVFPNPANDVLNIKLNENKPCQVSIYDMGGRLVLQENKQATEDNINISTLSKGIYSLQVMSGDNKQIVVFVKD